MGADGGGWGRPEGRAGLTLSESLPGPPRPPALTKSHKGLPLLGPAPELLGLGSQPAEQTHS